MLLVRNIIIHLFGFKKQTNKQQQIIGLHFDSKLLLYVKVRNVSDLTMKTCFIEMHSQWKILGEGMFMSKTQI